MENIELYEWEMCLKKRISPETQLSEVDREEVKRFGEEAINAEIAHFALWAYATILKDKEGVRRVAEKCRQLGEDFSATQAFIFLEDRSALLDLMIEAKNKGRKYELNQCGEGYLGETHRVLLDGFKQWTASKSYDNVLAVGDTPCVLNMAHHLADQYEVGVGIAKGGLYVTYLFNLYGLDTLIAEGHRKRNGATFKWIEGEGKQIANKKVVVFDKDVVTGRTLRKVVAELQQYNPTSLDLVLVHDPIEPGTIGIGTIASSIPREFREVYYPQDFEYSAFPQAVEKLEQKLGRYNG